MQLDGTSTRRRTRRIRAATAIAVVAVLGVGVAAALRLAPTGHGRSGAIVNMEPVHPAADPVPDQYIVVLRPETRGRVPEVARGLKSKFGGDLGFTYTAALNGFSIHASAAAAEGISHDPQVAYVEQDGYVRGSGTQTGTAWTPSVADGGTMECPCMAQSALPWNLDRIDQTTGPLNGAYTYNAAGLGVRAYVIDSGIVARHVEFTGRATIGADFVGDGRNGQDCNGHGTHVAGTVGGMTYGVAKQVSIVAVRVLDCNGAGTASAIIAGVNWVTSDHKFDDPAVANMSIRAPKDQAINDAVTASIGSGITYVVAAGNEAQDACNSSPASTEAAITVGASYIVDSHGMIVPDHPTYFSNYGPCVDVWAPGQDILSAWWRSTTATANDFGTSMAAPQVAGMAAIYLSTAPTAKPSEVGAAISANAVPVMTNLPAGSPNRLLNTSFGGSPAPNQANLLYNPSFEAGTSTTWTKRNLATGVAFTIQKNATKAQNGSWFAEASTASANGSVSTDLKASYGAGRSYSAGMWVRSPDGTPITGSLAIWGLGGTAESQTTRFTADGTWRFITVPLDAKNTGHDTVRVELYMDNVGKSYDFDAVQLIDTLMPNASFETGTASPWKKINAATGVNLTTYLNAPRAKDGASYAETNTSTVGGSVGQDLALTPLVGRTVAYSVWVRSATGATVTGAVNLWALGGTSESVSVPFTADGTWRLVTAPLTIRNAGHTSTRAEMYMNTTGQNYDFDGASIVLGAARY